MSERVFSLLFTASEGLLQKVVERFGVGILVRITIHTLLAYTIASLIVAYPTPHTELPIPVWYTLRTVSLPLAVLLLVMSILVGFSQTLAPYMGETLRDLLNKTMDELAKEGYVDEEKALEIAGKLLSDKIKQSWKVIILLLLCCSYWVSLVSIMVFIHRFYWEFLSVSIAWNYTIPLIIVIIVVVLTVAQYRDILPESSRALTRGLLEGLRLTKAKRLVEFISLFAPPLIPVVDKTEGFRVFLLAVIPSNMVCYGSPSNNNSQICKIVNGTEMNRKRWLSENVFKNALKMIEAKDVNLVFVTQEYISTFLEYLKKNTQYNLDNLAQIRCSEVAGKYVNAEGLSRCVIRAVLESFRNSYASADEFFAISRIVLDVQLPVELPTTKYIDRAPDVFSYRLCFCEFCVKSEAPCEKNYHTSLYVIASWGRAVRKVNGAGLATTIKLAKQNGEGVIPRRIVIHKLVA